MPMFGRFEIVDELYRTPFGCVYSARAAGQEAIGRRSDYVVKVYEPPAFQGEDSLGPGQNGSKEFQARAQVQQKVCEAEGRHWAPIHDVGISEGKPYYVTDYYPRTAQRLIAGRVILDAAALHEIIGSVAQGLRELRESCQQPHGGLKPSNILIGGSGGVSGAKIVLTDPLPAAGQNGDGPGGDSYALGTLLYQLVMHRPFRNTAWPVDDSPEWARLGKSADRWRMLCTVLLNPDSRQRPDFGSLEQSLAELAPGGFSIRKVAAVPNAALRSLPMRKVAVGASALLIAAGGTMGFLGLKTSSCRAHVDTARREWLDDLWKNKANRLGSLNGVPVIQQADWNAINASPATNFGFSAFRRSEAANAAVEQIRSRLQKDYETAGQPLRAFQQSFEHDGYNQAANYLNDVISAAPSNDVPSLIVAINARLMLDSKLQGNPRPAVSQQAAAGLKRLAASNDPDLQAFAKVMAAAFPSAWNLSDKGWIPTAGVDFDGLVNRLNVKGWPADYDEAQLNRDLKLNLNDLNLADVEVWVSQVGNYQKVNVPPDQLAKTDHELNSLLSTTRDNLQKRLELFPTENQTALNGLKAECAGIETQIAGLGRQQFLRKDFGREFASVVDAIKGNVQSLPARYHSSAPADVSAWTATLSVRGKQFRSPAARALWGKWVQERSPNQINETWMKQTDGLEATLQGLESEFAVPAGLEGEPWASAAQARSDDALARVIKGIAAPKLKPDSQSVRASHQDLMAWFGNSEKLKDELNRINATAKIDKAFIKWHEDQWASDWNFFNENATGSGPFAAVMKPALVRLNTVDRVLKSTHPEELESIVLESDKPEMVLAAWSALGDLKGQSFPGTPTPSGIGRWAKLLSKVVDTSTSLIPSAQAAVQAQVRQSGRDMLLAAVKHDDSRETLSAVVDASTLLKVPLPADGLTSEQSFNLALCAAVRSQTPENLALLKASLEKLPDYDRFQLQQDAAGGDAVNAIIRTQSYVSPELEQKWQAQWKQRQAQIARQIQGADTMLADGQPIKALTALEGLSGDAADREREKIQSRIAGRNREHSAGLISYGKADFKSAVEHFELAAEGGNTAAMINLGGMYRDGHPPVLARDLNQALQWFTRAADAGDPNGSVELAATDLTMSNRWQDAASALERAVPLIKAEPNPRLAEVMRELAKKYDSSNPSKRFWFQKAADYGDGQAKTWLAAQSQTPPPSHGNGPSLIDKKTDK